MQCKPACSEGGLDEVMDMGLMDKVRCRYISSFYQSKQPIVDPVFADPSMPLVVFFPSPKRPR